VKGDPILGVLDVETTYLRVRRRPVTRFWGCALETGEYHRFESTADLVEWLSWMPQMRLYHHHDFDICQMITDGVIPSGLQARGTRIVRSKLGIHDLVNSHALFPAPLAKILEAVGSKKLPLGIDGHPVDCACAGCAVALGERNRSDCVEGLRAFLQISDAYEDACGINPIRGGYTTAAGAAFRAAEDYAGDLPVCLERRSSYRGGRVEAFRLRDCGEADCWDINSSYPAAFVDIPPVDWLIHAEVAVKNEDSPRPFFREGSEGLIFPAGKFRTWFFASNYERYYEPHGGIEAVRVLEKVPVDFSWIHRVSPLVSRIYADRVATKSDAMRFAKKIFLNSIYGRLGLKENRQVVRHTEDLPAEEDYTAYKIPQGGYLTFVDVPGKPKANYEFAAAITDNSRARLYAAMMSAHTYYCDTDSVYCKPGTFRSREGAGLGEWKYEGSAHLKIRTVKDYEFGAKEVRKGQNKTRTIWTVKLALAGEGARGVGIKRRRTRYNKRRVRSDGSTAPLKF
jgi:hypothetical protein